VDSGTIAGWRLAKVGLTPARRDSPADALAPLSAIQAQELLPARWSLAQRCIDVPTEFAVEQAHTSGEFVRTHTLRPTWHFVSAADLTMLLAATSARVHQANKHMYGQTGVTEQLMRRARRVFESLLGRRPATRPDVQRALAKVGIDADGVRLALVIMWAELDGWICSGPNHGGRQTYALVSDRVAQARAWDVDEAQAALALRYFESRGPATMKDFATWSSLTLTQARRAVEEVAGRLETLEHDGRTYWFGGALEDAEADSVVSLVQTYDEVVMSYSESRDVLTGGMKLWDLPTRRFMHPVLVDGRLAGHWRYERDRNGRPEVVEMRLERSLDADETASAEAEVSRFAAFAGRDVTWRR
jgi:hypothetical protein